MGPELNAWVPLLAMIVTAAVAWGGMRSSHMRVTEELRDLRLAVAEFRATVSSVATLTAVVQSLQAELARDRAAQAEHHHRITDLLERVARLEPNERRPS